MNLEIPITKQSEIFKEHLEDPKNERIIFSGIFGIGKSYFLEKYFKDKEEYVAINLKPINYSISSNEDIFRLVKYDILYELIFTHELELVVESVSRGIAYGVALGNKIPNLIESFLPIIPLLNKEASDFTPLLGLIKKISPFIEEVEKSRKDVNSNYKLEDFVKEIEKGYTFESDFITEFIEKSLDKLATEKKKHKILIIDDLDRIDPEHIFRLFNIFSAHFDYHKSSTNKFGFDKVIFVCDINNIRNIFEAKYGINVDFSGYIDKFYSTEVYYFNNDEEVAAATDRILDGIDFGKHKEFLKEQLFRHYGKGLLFFLVNACIRSGSLSMRRIKSVFGCRYKFHEQKLTLINRPYVHNSQLPSVIALDILVWIFGSIEAVDKALHKLIQFGKNVESNYINNGDRLAGYFIPLLDYQKHRFIAKNFSGSTSSQYEITIKDKVIVYELQEVGRNINQYWADIKTVNGENNIEYNTFLFEVIYQAFQILKGVNYIK